MSSSGNNLMHHQLDCAISDIAQTRIVHPSQDMRLSRLENVIPHVYSRICELEKLLPALAALSNTDLAVLIRLVKRKSGE